MGKVMSEELLHWRRKQKRGRIMHPSTFRKIRQEAREAGVPVDRAQKIAGKAYWATAKKKFRNRNQETE